MTACRVMQFFPIQDNEKPFTWEGLKVRNDTNMSFPDKNAHSNVFTWLYG